MIERECIAKGSIFMHNHTIPYKYNELIKLEEPTNSSSPSSNHYDSR